MVIGEKIRVRFLNLIGHSEVLYNDRQGDVGRDGKDGMFTLFFMQLEDFERILQSVVGISYIL